MVMPEYMQIRAYLYNMISKTNDPNMQIPPENELARLFGVSRVTVRGAIKGLVKDKFLVPKRGLGTFVNTAKLSRNSFHMPTIGLINGDGRHVKSYFTPAIAESVRQCGMDAELVFIPDSRSPERIIEIARKEMDAVIWENPQHSKENMKILEAFKAASIPVLSLNMADGESFGENDCIVRNMEQAHGTDLAEYLHSLGHKDLLLLHNSLGSVSGKGSSYDGYCKKMSELCNGESINTAAFNLPDFIAELDKTGADFLKPFSVIYVISSCLPYAVSAINKAGIKIPDDISLLVYGNTNRKVCNGLKADFVDDFSQLQDHISDWLISRVQEKANNELFIRTYKNQMIRGETIKAR